MLKQFFTSTSINDFKLSDSIYMVSFMLNKSYLSPHLSPDIQNQNMHYFLMSFGLYVTV